MPAKSKSTDAASLLSEEAIRDRAYFMWEADGRPDGGHDHYWSRAHAEATKAFIEATSNGVAKATKGKTANAAPPAVKATKATKEKVKAKAKPAKVAEAKPKKATKPRAAVPAAK
ncbi:DUF2934 domain-containing protein [Devosia ginsengisoli]|uniref:DUF2934 domain-containing protein n=1 Tax=Devosia ginsengisoli TaxID=400770 RepID=UPI0026EBD938|nr:DUF2934 domain-containing protein [Devosia ginsengisoli]MCR6671508.1 DUF2934 domain-containing protein [Devosia ginsengisoli]